MPEGYRPPRAALAIHLSHHHADGMLVRARCRCSTRHYYPADLIKVLGNIPVLHVQRHLRHCAECGARDSLRVSFVLPSAAERLNLRIRKLVEIRTKRIPIWQDE